MSKRRYVVLTPFARPEIVAGTLRLRGLEAYVVGTKSGVCVVRDVDKPTFTDWDIAELLGGEPDVAPEQENPSDNPDNIAGPLSELSDYGVVVLTAELGDDVGGEAGVSGMVTAVRYLKGERGEDVQAGTLLNVVDPKVEHLIIGTVDLGKDAILTSDLSVQDVEKYLGITKDDE